MTIFEPKEPVNHLSLRASEPEYGNYHKPPFRRDNPTEQAREWLDEKVNFLNEVMKFMPRTVKDSLTNHKYNDEKTDDLDEARENYADSFFNKGIYEYQEEDNNGLWQGIHSPVQDLLFKENDVDPNYSRLAGILGVPYDGRISFGTLEGRMLSWRQKEINDADGKFIKHDGIEYYYIDFEGEEIVYDIDDGIIPIYNKIDGQDYAKYFAKGVNFNPTLVDFQHSSVTNRDDEKVHDYTTLSHDVEDYYDDYLKEAGIYMPIVDYSGIYGKLMGGSPFYNLNTSVDERESYSYNNVFFEGNGLNISNGDFDNFLTKLKDEFGLEVGKDNYVPNIYELARKGVDVSNWDNQEVFFLMMLMLESRRRYTSAMGSLFGAESGELDIKDLINKYADPNIWNKKDDVGFYFDYEHSNRNDRVYNYFLPPELGNIGTATDWLKDRGAEAICWRAADELYKLSVFDSLKQYVPIIENELSFLTKQYSDNVDLKDKSIHSCLGKLKDMVDDIDATVYSRGTDLSIVSKFVNLLVDTQKEIEEFFVPTRSITKNIYGKNVMSTSGEADEQIVAHSYNSISGFKHDFLEKGSLIFVSNLEHNYDRLLDDGYNLNDIGADGNIRNEVKNVLEVLVNDNINEPDKFQASVKKIFGFDDDDEVSGSYESLFSVLDTAQDKHSRLFYDIKSIDQYNAISYGTVEKEGEEIGFIPYSIAKTSFNSPFVRDNFRGSDNLDEKLSSSVVDRMYFTMVFEMQKMSTFYMMMMFSSPKNGELNFIHPLAEAATAATDGDPDTGVNHNLFLDPPSLVGEFATQFWSGTFKVGEDDDGEDEFDLSEVGKYSGLKDDLINTMNASIEEDYDKISSFLTNLHNKSNSISSFFSSQGTIQYRMHDDSIESSNPSLNLTNYMPPPNKNDIYNLKVTEEFVEGFEDLDWFEDTVRKALLDELMSKIGNLELKSKSDDKILLSVDRWSAIERIINSEDFNLVIAYLKELFAENNLDLELDMDVLSLGDNLDKPGDIMFFRGSTDGNYILGEGTQTATLRKSLGDEPILDELITNKWRIDSYYTSTDSLLVNKILSGIENLSLIYNNEPIPDIRAFRNGSSVDAVEFGKYLAHVVAPSDDLTKPDSQANSTYLNDVAKLTTATQSLIDSSINQKGTFQAELEPIFDTTTNPPQVEITDDEMKRCFSLNLHHPEYTDWVEDATDQTTGQWEKVEMVEVTDDDGETVTDGDGNPVLEEKVTTGDYTQNWTRERRLRTDHKREINSEIQGSSVEEWKHLKQTFYTYEYQTIDGGNTLPDGAYITKPAPGPTFPPQETYIPKKDPDEYLPINDPSDGIVFFGDTFSWDVEQNKVIHNRDNSLVTATFNLDQGKMKEYFNDSKRASIYMTDWAYGDSFLLADEKELDYAGDDLFDPSSINGELVVNKTVGGADPVENLKSVNFSYYNGSSTKYGYDSLADEFTRDFIRVEDGYNVKAEDNSSDQNYIDAFEGNANINDLMSKELGWTAQGEALSVYKILVLDHKTRQKVQKDVTNVLVRYDNYYEQIKGILDIENINSLKDLFLDEFYMKNNFSKLIQSSELQGRFADDTMVFSGGSTSNRTGWYETKGRFLAGEDGEEDLTMDFKTFKYDVDTDYKAVKNNVSESTETEKKLSRRSGWTTGFDDYFGSLKVVNGEIEGHLTPGQNNTYNASSGKNISILHQGFELISNYQEVMLANLMISIFNDENKRLDEREREKYEEDMRKYQEWQWFLEVLRQKAASKKKG